MSRLLQKVESWVKDRKTAAAPVRRRLVALCRRLGLDRFLERHRRHSPNRARIEIDLTTKCNMRCFNCDMSVRQAPSNDHLSLEQIERFVTDSLDRGWRWSRIRLIGGEPTLHPQFSEVLALLKRYRDRHPDCRVEVVTNGHGPAVEKVLERVPDWVAVDNSRKKSDVQEFLSFNEAPIDLEGYEGEDFSKGCFVTSDCGLGLGRGGYYACAIAAGMDRVLGHDVGVKRLADVNDAALRDQLRRFCGRCGYFRTRRDRSGRSLTVTAERMSPSWVAAYEEYRKAPPRLTPF